MKEVDPNDAPPGYMAIAGYNCKECAFDDDKLSCMAARCTSEYRHDACAVIFIKRKLTAPLNIPWDRIKPEFRFAAKSEDGRITLFTEEPAFFEDDGEWAAPGCIAGINRVISDLDPDNVAFYDSLTVRPK